MIPLRKFLLGVGIIFLKSKFDNIFNLPLGR